MTELTHGEFIDDYRAGRIRVQVDRERAAAFISSRMMLPLILLPFLGLGIGLAIGGYLAAGVGVFVFALLFRFFVRSSSHGFVLLRALDNAKFYREAVAAGALRWEEERDHLSGVGGGGPSA